MKLKKYGMLFAALGLLASCSNETLDAPATPGGEEGDMSGTYLSLNLNPETRTATPDQGSQDGTTDENAIKSLLIALVDPATNNVLVTKTVTSTGISSNTATFELTNTDFSTMSNYSGSTVKVYVVANPNGVTIRGNNYNPANHTVNYNTDDNSLWSTANGFQMSNADNNFTLPVDPVGIKNGVYTSENPMNLGTVNVKRTMARLDLAKGQPTNGVSEVKVTLDGIALVNLSKQFYLYKQVGSGDSYTLFADETATNFVKDPKTAWNNTTLLYAVADGQKASELTYKNDWFETTALESSNIAYTTWRYATPNTVMKTEDQKNGKSTGIVFRAKMTKNDGNALDGNELLVYFGKVWGDLANLKQIAANPQGAEQEQIAYVYNSAKGSASSDTEILANLKAQGFTVYPKDADGNFYCYYYYWVRHNAPDGSFNNGVMTPMEFGVVRNNIYKIAVTNIAALGKPGDFVPDVDEDDDPEHPEDPTSATLEVSIQVKPWEVRIDNVGF